MTASVKRGEVFLVNFDPTVAAETKKSRPADTRLFFGCFFGQLGLDLADNL